MPLNSIAARKSAIPSSVRTSCELALIEASYGEQRARRSGVPLVHHIHEGVALLVAAGASELAQRAFCLHPLVQNDVDLARNYSGLVQALSETPDGMRALLLAMEYRSVANEYLAHKPNQPGGIRLSPLPDVNLMLLADKVQNQRDFLFYHGRSHPNRERLTEYFEQWVAALLPACGIEDLSALTAELPPLEPIWHSPLPLALVPTEDSMSFQSMPPGCTGLPTGRHPGAFGVERTHHIHEGVDLYCPTGTLVHAVEGGEVVEVAPFTGPSAGMPWWHDTQVALVEGPSGVVAYGEIAPTVTRGQRVQTGDPLGQVVQVLRKNKGRPVSMLHLELHTEGTRTCLEWAPRAPRPPSLRDPTALLAAALPAVN